MKYGRLAIEFIYWISSLTHENHFARLKQRNEENFTELIGIPYALDDSDVHSFNLYCPIKNSNGIIIFDIHGGVRKGSNVSNYEQDIALAKRGFIIAAMNYELIDEKKDDGVLNAIKDIISCISHCYKERRKFGFSFDKVVLKGDGYGGYLALLITEIVNSKELQKEFDIKISERIKISSLLLDSPIYDLDNLYDSLSKNICESALSCIFSSSIQNEDYRKKFNPKTYLSIDIISPIFITVNSRNFYANHSIILDNELNRMDGRYEFIFNRDRCIRKQHIFDIVELKDREAINATDEMIKFLENIFMNQH
ncbi:MAG: hypothetical protein WC366_00380 [Bacilli bacterium]|jgi:hypothetical protein